MELLYLLILLAVLLGFFLDPSAGIGWGILFLIAYFSIKAIVDSVNKSKKVEVEDFNIPDFDIKITSTIVTGKSEYPLPNEFDEDHKAEFIEPGRSIAFEGVVLKGPVFISEPVKDFYRAPVASLVPRQKIAISDVTNKLNYNPRYVDLDPYQRNRFLQWMSGDRGFIDDIGYVFVYFAGIERYVYEVAGPEGSFDQVILESIKDEVVRLLEVFKESTSFDMYAKNLLSYMYVTFWPERIDEILSYGRATMPALVFYLARHAATKPNEPLNAKWALEWAIYRKIIKNKNDLDRQHSDLLLEIFSVMYKQVLPKGLKVPKNKTRANLPIRPSDYRVNCDGIHLPSDWADPTELKGPHTKLSSVVESVLPIFRSIKNGEPGEISLKTILALPASVHPTRLPQGKEVSDKIDELFPAEDGFIELGKVASLFADAKPTATGTMPKTVMIKLGETLDRFGIGLVPSFAFNHVSLNEGSRIILYRGELLSELSPSGLRLMVKVRLLVMIAISDGEFSQDESEYIKTLVEAHPNEVERRYLYHYINWLAEQKQSMSGLKSLIGAMDEAAREGMARELCKIATVDGVVEKAEKDQLIKLFKALELDVSNLDGMLAEMLPAASSTDGDVESEQKQGLNLDMSKLAEHKRDTDKIQSVLHSIFSDEDDDEVESETIEEHEEEDILWYTGKLNETQTELLEWIMQRPSWNLEEVETKCKKLNLAIDPVIEAINHVAIDVFGDVILEIDDGLDVYLDVITE